MELEELKERYQTIPFWLRIILMIILGLIPAVYILMEKGQDIDVKLQTAQSDYDLTKTNFERAKFKKEDLPKLQAKLSYTEANLQAARKVLPDSFEIDEILLNTASLAKDSNVELFLFDPTDEVTPNHTDRYRELPINMKINGSYKKIARFFDRLVHQDQMVHLRNVELTTISNKNDEGQSEKTINANASLIVFRGLGVSQ